MKGMDDWTLEELDRFLLVFNVAMTVLAASLVALSIWVPATRFYAALGAGVFSYGAGHGWGVHFYEKWCRHRDERKFRERATVMFDRIERDFNERWMM